MPYRHSKVGSVLDDSDVSKVQPSDVALFTAPVMPQDGDIWFEATGVSPARTITIYIRDQGVTRAIASATF